MEPELSRQLAEAETSSNLIAYVQGQLFTAIPSGNFSIDSVAQQLGMSTRSLQRYLKNEGTSFKDQVQKVQKSMAVSYIKMGLTTDEISSLLGYSEPQAFKKWIGMTIGTYKTISRN
ncbi:helix-turn-helix domain-containing protein [Streptococcus sp. 20-1249]|uniref:helix-turn-helix domain-containing protein n=1 Tax=Streptococcus hepaticus TaxID=3349163 RepID=UPI0029880180